MIAKHVCRVCRRRVEVGDGGYCRERGCEQGAKVPEGRADLIKRLGEVRGPREGRGATRLRDLVEAVRAWGFDELPAIDWDAVVVELRTFDSPYARTNLAIETLRGGVATAMPRDVEVVPFTDAVITGRSSSWEKAFTDAVVASMPADPATTMLAPPMPNIQFGLQPAAVQVIEAARHPPFGAEVLDVAAGRDLDAPGAIAFKASRAKT
jgi:hypothetical protein